MPPPIVGKCLLWQNGWMYQDATWYTEVGLGPGDIVLHWDQLRPKKMGTAAPTFRPMYCAHMAGWIKMSLGAEIGLGSGHVVLDKDPAPIPKRGGGTTDPQFSAHVCCGQTAGWIKMPLDTEVVLGPGHIVLDGDPASSFRSMSVVAKRSPISATAEHLSV